MSRFLAWFSGSGVVDDDGHSEHSDDYSIDEDDNIDDNDVVDSDKDDDKSAANQIVNGDDDVTDGADDAVATTPTRSNIQEDNSRDNNINNKSPPPSQTIPKNDEGKNDAVVVVEEERNISLQSVDNAPVEEENDSDHLSITTEDDDVVGSSEVNNDTREEYSDINNNKNLPPPPAAAQATLQCDEIVSDEQHNDIAVEEGDNNIKSSQSVDDPVVAVEETPTNNLNETQPSTNDENQKDDSSLTGEVDNALFAETKQSLVSSLDPTTTDEVPTEQVKTTDNDQEEEILDDSFPKAREFLSETINDDDATTFNHRDDDITVDSISRTRKAAEIVEGFDEYNDYAADDSKTIATNRTSISRVQPVSAAFKSASQEVAKKKNAHPHQSIFDILEKNFEELGEGGSGGGSMFGKKISYQDVKLCFVAFVAVFSLPQEPVFANPVYSETNGVAASDKSNGDNVDELGIENQQYKSATNGDKQRLNAKSVNDESEPRQKKSATRPSVPLSVAFALWNKVLQQSHGTGNEFTNDNLSYIRSTLVLLGLLELKSIERDRDDDVAQPPSSNNRLMGYSSNRSIECLSVHDEIHQQYGEFLAWGDQDGSLRSHVEKYEQRWNEAAMNASNQIGYNQYTLRMLPLNTMRANQMQDAFDLLKDKTFVRRRMRGLGASEAAKAQVGDVDEILVLIEKLLSKRGGENAEPIDEQAALLSAYLQLKKYCLHEAEELARHYKDEDGNIKLGKAMMPKMADLGDAVHLMGASLGGYGFYDEEMEYYEEALRLKRLAVNGNIMKSVTAAETLHCMGFSLDNVGKGDDALECYDQALDIRLDCLGDNDLRVADTYHNKGALLCEEDRPDEAMECLEEALRIRELHYGEEHVSCADTMQWMGNLLRKHGDPSDALDYFKFALRIKQATLGSDDIDVANTLFNTAVLLDDLEKFELSLVAYKEALRIRKLVLGDKSPEVADTLFCMGNVATAMEKHSDALAYFKESIELMETLIKESDSSINEKDDNLLFIFNPPSIPLDQKSQYEKLNQAYEEALPLTKLIMGSDHANVCDILTRMGDLYKTLHDWDNAAGSFQGAVRARRAETPDDDGYEVAELLQKKGVTHLYKREFIRAKATFEVALQIWKKVSGADSIPIASATYCLGVAYYYLGDYSHSKLLFEECQRIQAKLFGEDSQNVATSFCWLGRQHEKLNDPNTALERYLSALQILKKEKASADYHVVILLLHAIGKMYQHEEVNLLDMSLKCFVQEIGVIRSKLDEEDCSTWKLLADAHFKAGMLYKIMKDTEEAIEHLSKALDYTKRYSNEESHRLATITDALGMLYASKEEFEEAKKYYSSAYSIYEKVSRNDQITSDCVFRLSKVLEVLKSELTLDFYKESLRVQRVNVERDDERVAEILFCLGRVCLTSGLHRDAVKYFEEALTLRKQLRKDSVDVADTYHHLGMAHDKLKEREKALIFFKESVRINKSNSDKNALYRVSLDMANCAAACSQFSLAIDSYNDCLMATDGLENRSHDADVLEKMGDIELHKLRKFEDATKHFLDALEMCRASEHPDSNCDIDEQTTGSNEEEKSSTVLTLLYKTAQSYSLSGDYENALDYFEEHIKMVESASSLNEELLADSLLQMGNIFANGDDPDFDMAVEKLLECLDIKKNVFGPENEHVADVNYALGLVYEKANDTNKATTHLAEALRFFKMKRNKAGAANVYHTLARMKASECAKTGSPDDRAAAMECYEEALKVRRQVMSLDDTDLASILYEYATLLCDDGELQGALPLLEEALRIQKSSKGLKDARVANILLKIAEVHVEGGRFDSSLVSLEQVILIEGSVDNSDDIDLGACQYLLGVTYIAREDFEKAIDALVEAQKLKESMYGRKSLECASVYNMLGKAYGKRQMFDKAIESLVKALRIRKVELGNDSLEYGDSVFNLAEIHIAMNKHDQALNCLDEALRVYEAQEADSDQIIQAMEMKGDCLNEIDDYEASATTFQECIDVFHDASSDHEEVIASLSLKLGKSYAKLNDYDNAFGAYRESIRILSETCGAADLRVGDVMFEVGVLMCDQGSSDVSDKSIECFTEMIRVYTENGEATHTNVANALIHKATALIDRSEYDEAGAAIDEALKIYKSSLGNEAVEIGKAMLLYGTLHDAQNKNDDAMAAFNAALDIFRDTSGEELNVSLALSNIGIIHARKAEFEEAVDKCKEALEIRKMHEGSDHDVAESLFNIGNILDQWSKEEALQYFEDSLKLYQSLPDEEDLAIANCLFKIGSVYWRRKNVNKSLRSYQESLRHCSNVEEEDVDSLLMSVYKGLADCYFEKDRYGKALDNYVECLKIQKVELEDGSTEIAYTCHRIGLIYQKEEEYGNAMDFHSKALEILEASCDEGTKDCSASDLEVARILLLTEEYEEALRRLENHLDKYCNDEDMSENVASVYELLGAAQRNLDQCNESIASLNKALDIRTKLFGETSAQVANTLVDLGRVMEDVSDGSDDAISLYDQAITIYQQIPDIDSAKVVGAYTRLAHLLDEKGNHEASLQSLKRALKLCSDCNGTDSVEVAEILHRLGKTYDHLGNYEKSSACFTRSVKIFRFIDDDYGVYISQALSFVGRNYARRKQFGKAVELCTESLKMQKELIGEVELVDIAHSLLNIGDIMNQWDKPEQALQFYEEALNSYEEVVGFDSLDVAMCKYNIGVVKKSAGESEKALKCFGEALKIHRTKEGDKSLNVATDLFQIAQIYDSYGNLKKALACFEECVRIRNDVLDEDHLDVLAARRYVSTLRKKMMQ